MRHEVAYVLGQMQDDQAVDVLEEVLADASDDGMVRHEAAEALGAIANEKCKAILTGECPTPNPNQFNPSQPQSQSSPNPIPIPVQSHRSQAF